MRLKLRLNGLIWLKRQVKFNHEHGPSQVLEPNRDLLASAMHEAVRLAARLQLDTAHCLPKSLVLAKTLQKRGYSTRVIIGVLKRGEGIASHAWLEIEHRGKWFSLGEPERTQSSFTPV